MGTSITTTSLPNMISRELLYLIFIFQSYGRGIEAQDLTSDGLQVEDLDEFLISNEFKTVHVENGNPVHAVYHQKESSEGFWKQTTNSSQNYTIFCCNFTTGEIENKTCGGNGVDCCTACNDTFTGDEPGDCLAVLFVPDKNQQQAAEHLCKTVMKEGPEYCKALPQGLNIINSTKRQIDFDILHSSRRFGPTYIVQLDVKITRKSGKFRGIIRFLGRNNSTNLQSNAFVMGTQRKHLVFKLGAKEFKCPMKLNKWNTVNISQDNKNCEWIDEVIVNGKGCFKTKDKLFADPLRNVSLILGDLQTTSKTYGMIKNLYVTNFGNSDIITGNEVSSCNIPTTPSPSIFQELIINDFACSSMSIFSLRICDRFVRNLQILQQNQCCCMNPTIWKKFILNNDECSPKICPSCK